jgi:hypothetical protein
MKKWMWVAGSIVLFLCIFFIDRVIPGQYIVPLAILGVCATIFVIIAK